MSNKSYLVNPLQEVSLRKLNQGTLAPNIVALTTNFSSITYTQRLGSYRVIDNQIYLAFWFAWDAASGGTGDVAMNIGDISPLSYASSTFHSASYFYARTTTGASNTRIASTVSSGGNYILKTISQSGAFSDLPTSAITSGSFTKFYYLNGVSTIVEPNP